MKTTKPQTLKELKAEIKTLKASLEFTKKRLEDAKPTFNKYEFIRELKENIASDIKSGNLEANDDAIHEYITESIDRACIYYSDCFDIAKELNATDFTVFDGECNNINTVAYMALQNFMYSEIDIEELIPTSEDKEVESED